MCLVTKEVELLPGRQPEVYHCVAQPDYVVVLARIRGGLIPIVRQYRPAVEAYTWELPAGLVEGGESPEDTCRRELWEETGVEAEHVLYLGNCYPDTGRLENRLHAFFVEGSSPDSTVPPQDGMLVEFVTGGGLAERVLSGEFRHQLHLAVITLASLNGIDPWH